MTHPNELLIVNRLLDTVLARGFEVRIWDGEAWAGPRSSHKADILANMFATDGETVRLYRDGLQYGAFSLIYGTGDEGRDLISDCTTNVDKDICEAVQAYAETLPDAPQGWQIVDGGTTEL